MGQELSPIVRVILCVYTNRLSRFFEGNDSCLDIWCQLSFGFSGRREDAFLGEFMSELRNPYRDVDWSLEEAWRISIGVLIFLF